MRKSSRPLLTLGLVAGLSTPALAEPALWEVRDDDSAIWVFGSFHLLPPDFAWRTALFDQVLADADVVVFETDIRPEAMAQVGAEAFARGMYVDGTLLTDRIDDALEARLREEAAAVGAPMGMLLAMRPWMAGNTITVSAAASLGFTQEGVEFVLQPDVTADRLSFLETGNQQLDVLAGAPEDEQIAMLEATLDQMHLLPKMLDKMVRNWAAGTPENLERMFLMEMGGFEEAFLDRLIYQRNQNWIPPLETMLAENDEGLVIVGAAHLVGERSVLDLLAQAGYEVKRIQ